MPAIAALGSGNTFAEVSTSTLAGFRIAFPSLAEQRGIADRLDAAMADIGAASEALARQRAEAVKLAAVALEVAFGGRAIAAAGDQSIVGSDWVALTDVAKLESGHTPSRKRPEWWGGNIPWIALPDIRALDGKVAITTGEQTNALGLANSSARLLPAGTVVLSRTASVGFVTVMGVPMATSQDFVDWVPGNRLRSWYLAYALISAREYIRGLSEGAIHKTIYMPTLKGLRIRLPNLDKQDQALKRITEVHAHLEASFIALDRQAAALDVLGSSLLNTAFQGKL